MVTMAPRDPGMQTFLRSVALLRDRVPDFAQYPFAMPAVRQLDQLVFHPRVTFLVGENGSGKSTLAEAIAVGVGLNAEGGTQNFNFANRRSESVLHQYLRFVRGVRRPRNSFFLRAESFFNVATNIEKLDENDPESAPAPPVINSYGGASLHHQSHGESFLALFKNRFGPHGLYVLDEPEAALSPQRQLVLLKLIHDLASRRDCQFIIATHSPIVLAYPDALIYSLDGSAGPKPTRYEDTEHFSLTRDFLMNRERYLAQLMTREA